MEGFLTVSTDGPDVVEVRVDSLVVPEQLISHLVSRQNVYLKKSVD